MKSNNWTKRPLCKGFPLLGTLFLIGISVLFYSCNDLGEDDAAKLEAEGSSLEADASNSKIPYPTALRNALNPILGNVPETVGGIVYVSVDGGSNAIKDGSSWDKAYAASKLKDAINEAGLAASVAKPYLVLVASGNYPVTETLNMKNNVLIAGGIAKDGSLSSTKTTFDGGGSIRVFNNDDIDKSAVLYGVTITKGMSLSSGTAANSGGMYNTSSSPTLIQVIFSDNAASYGGGMFNDISSPSLIQVTFSGNTANYGGGMYNYGSSPILTQVTFSGNTTNNGHGGGMYNNRSSPILIQATFSDNAANDNDDEDGYGGGMFNGESSPILTQVTFSGNTANYGGGMYNNLSSPTLTQVTFFGNTATNGYGGGMFNNNGGEAGPTIINSIFWGNTASTATTGFQIGIHNDFIGDERLSIRNSVLQGGMAGISYKQPAVGAAAPVKTYVVSSGIITSDPTLANTTLELFAGVSVSIPTITTGSSAIDKGLYVQRKGSTLYYSEDASTWYTSFNTGTTAGTFTDVSAATLPSGAIDLTAKDITGYARKNRPDIGAYEAR